jgi:hypothetical protein
MSKKYRRNHSTKSISASRSYTFTEVAEKMNVQKKTVYGWKKKGLPVIDGSSPERMHGSDIIEFHKKQKAGQKRKCHDNEMLCCSCKIPRQVANYKIEIENRTSKIINFKGKCEVCNCNMNRTISPEKLEYFKQAFLTRKDAQLTLIGF